VILGLPHSRPFKILFVSIIRNLPFWGFFLKGLTSFNFLNLILRLFHSNFPPRVFFREARIFAFPFFGGCYKFSFLTISLVRFPTISLVGFWEALLFSLFSLLEGAFSSHLGFSPRDLGPFF